MLSTKKFYSKPCFLQKKFYSKPCFLQKFFIQNRAFKKNFFPQNRAFFLKKKFFFKIVLYKTARKTQNLRILRGKLNQNVIFFCANFSSKSCVSKIFFSSKSCFLKIFFSSKWCFLEKFFLQNHAF